MPPPAPTPTFSITGTVYIDTNKNGVKDSGEKGYSGATITLNTGQTGQTVTTDANGNYRFSNLPPSDTYVEALTVPDGYKATTQSLVNIELNGNTIQNFGIVQTTSTITPTQPIPEPVPIPQQPTQPIKELGSISGFKINDLNGNGKWDAGEKGLPGWEIRLKGIGTKTFKEERKTTTDNQGFYIFDDLPAGKYTLTEKNKKGFVSTDPVKFVTLAPGQDSKNNNFTNTLLLAKIAPTSTPFSCSDAPLTFPIRSVDSNGNNAYIGWLYKESTNFDYWQQYGATKWDHENNGIKWIDKSEYHSGLDFWASPGTPVMGQATGTIFDVEDGQSGTFKLTIKYPDITYLDNKGNKNTGDVYVYIDNLVGKGKINGKEQEIKVPKKPKKDDPSPDPVWAGKIIGFIGTAYGGNPIKLKNRVSNLAGHLGIVNKYLIRT